MPIFTIRLFEPVIAEAPGGNGMENNGTDKVVLLPKTVDYYQIELTKMLETEKYAEAIGLLEFLLGCKPVDRQTGEEWQALLGWLRTAYPGHLPQAGADTANEEEEENFTESDLFKQHLKQKTDEDRQYVQKLIALLQQSQALDKQILALEQLTFIDHPDIDPALIKWLSDNEIHPLIQFKALQSLKRRGASGIVSLPKNGETVKADIEETPLGPEHFPAPIADIMNKLQRTSETEAPDLAEFARQIWQEFVAFIYATPVYRQLLSQEQDTSDAWAAALHAVLQEILSETADKESVKEMYGITLELEFAFQQAYHVLHRFIQLVYPRAFHS